MPAGSVPRYKIIHCRQPHKKGKSQKHGKGLVPQNAKGNKNVIARIDRSKYPGWHVPAEVIIRKIMHHYKEKHPKKFKLSVAKSQETRSGQMIRKATHSKKKKLNGVKSY